MTGAPSHATFPPAVILAGGLSSRMGRPKAGLLLGGRSMLTRVIERLRPQVAGIAINLNADPDPASAFGLEVVPDTIPGFVGPLAGILAAMRHTVRKSPGASHVLTVPVDTPLFPKSLAARLKTAITSGVKSPSLSRPVRCIRFSRSGPSRSPMILRRGFMRTKSGASVPSLRGTNRQR